MSNSLTYFTQDINNFFDLSNESKLFNIVSNHKNLYIRTRYYTEDIQFTIVNFNIRYLDLYDDFKYRIIRSISLIEENDKLIISFN